MSPGDLSPGLRATYSEVSLRSVRSLDTVPVIREDIAPVVTRLGNERPEHYARIFRGYLRIPVDGLYTFVLRSDDGSRLAIGDRVVIDHDGPHGTEDRHGTIALMSGLHPIEVRYFQAGGGAELRLLVRDRSGALLPVPPTWFVH